MNTRTTLHSVFVLLCIGYGYGHRSCAISHHGRYRFGIVLLLGGLTLWVDALYHYVFVFFWGRLGGR